MSRQNLELVRSLYDRWEAGDFTSVDWADPNVEYALVGGADSATYRGPVEMGRAWADWLSSFEDFGVRAEEMIEAGDRVLVLVRFGGRGKASGVSIDAMHDVGANVFEIRDGKVVRLLLYADRDEARRYVGLA